jgi:uroporphyrinogen III methyltransferase/synthase
VSATGKVVLVGAGPGDPDLLTLRGDAELRRADVVLYDSLAAPELLERVPLGAERIDVGKRGHDAPMRTQDEITSLMVARARDGKHVVRLKGGDPFVFGRGGEELSACREAGIEVEVVPGVSSVVGALAYAGIPVTDRRHAASFAVITGHNDPSKPRENLRWEGLARSADTLVVLMGMRNLEEIVARLLEGRAPETPAAVVMDGTLPRQRVLVATLGELPAKVRAAGLGSPAVVVVGDVVRLRTELAWFERLPLAGARVLVTRTPEQAPPWLEALRRAGADARLVPLIEIAPAGDAAEVGTALGDLARFDAVLFTSANGVRRFVAAAEERGVAPSGVRSALCVGVATAAAARSVGLPVDPLAPARSDAEGMLAAILEARPVDGLRFLWPCAAGARPVLPDGLRAAGAEVVPLPLYRSVVPPSLDAAALRAALAADEFDTLTFASPSAVRHFAELLDAPARAGAQRATVAAIGSVTAEAVAAVGLPAGVVPERPDAEALVAALAADWTKRRSA